MCCNRFIILFTWYIKNNSKENIFSLIVQYLEKYSSKYNSWHTGPGIQWTGKKSYGIGERKWEMGELKDRQQQETESELPFHSHLTLMTRVLVSC